jgi:hypothetical protein
VTAGCALPNVMTELTNVSSSSIGVTSVTGIASNPGLHVSLHSLSWITPHRAARSVYRRRLTRLFRWPPVDAMQRAARLMEVTPLALLTTSAIHAAIS